MQSTSLFRTSTGTETKHIEIWYVDQHHIDEVWPDVEHLVARTDDRETKSDDIYRAIKSGAWQLWVAISGNGVEAAASTSFVYYPTGKMCRVETIGGNNMSDWLFALKEIEDWAKLNDCIAMDIFGRKGWEKVLAPHDYEFEAILLRKRL